MQPGVVIGVGGTGKWVNTYIKRRLGGRVPDDLRLLCFDTLDWQEFVPVKLLQFNVRTGRAEDMKLDYGSGDTPEFYNFSAFWAQVVDDIKLGHGSNYPAVYEWLGDDAKAYNLSALQRNTKGGGGQMRQSTRVSLSLHASQIYAKVRAALSGMTGRVSQQNPLPVFVIASLAGGTGCGTVLDMAFMVHQAVTEIGEAGLSIAPLGIFLLARGFEGVHPNERERRLQTSNCYAAFRELHRFNIIAEGRFRYQTGQAASLGGKRPFDVCFFVDGSSVAGEPGNEVPHYRGTCAAIADYVLLSVGSETSQVSIIRNLVTPLGSALQQASQAPFDAAFYSTFGLHEWVLDVEELRMSFGLQIEQDMLDWMLDGRHGVDIEVEVQRDFLKAGSRRFTVRAPDGTTEEREFINSSFNTRLVADCLDHNGITPELELLRRGLGGASAGQLPAVDLSGVDCGSITRWRSFDQVQGEADDETEQVSRTFGSGLARLEQQHRDQLRDYLRAFLVHHVLNATDRAGALSHAESFLEVLLQKYRTFDERVKSACADLGLNDRIAAAENALKDYRQRKRKKEYVAELEAKARLQQLTELAEATMRLSDHCLGLVQVSVDAVARWRKTLADGRKKAGEAWRELTRSRNDDRNVRTRTYATIPDDSTEQRIYQLVTGRSRPDQNNPAEVELDKKLAHVDFNAISGKFVWHHSGDMLECYLPAEFSPMSVFRDDWLLWNYNFIGNYLNEGVLKKLSELSVADVLVLAGASPDKFGRELIDKSAELAGYDPQSQVAQSGGGPTDTTVARWLHYYMDDSVSPPGRALLLAASKVLSAENYIKVSKFTDRHRVVVFRGQHFIKPQGFVNIKNTEPVYRTGVTRNEPAPLHVLRGEREAAVLEEQFRAVLLEDPRCLHPRVVRLLDDADALRVFVYGLAFPSDFSFGSKVIGGDEKLVYTLGSGQVVELAPADDAVAAAHVFLGDRPEVNLARREAAVALDAFLNKKLANKSAFVAELRRLSQAVVFDKSSSDAANDFKRVQKLSLHLEAEKFA